MKNAVSVSNKNVITPSQQAKKHNRCTIPLITFIKKGLLCPVKKKLNQNKRRQAHFLFDGVKQYKT